VEVWKKRKGSWRKLPKALLLKTTFVGKLLRKTGLYYFQVIHLA
jgi:hypothetical protein